MSRGNQQQFINECTGISLLDICRLQCSTRYLCQVDSRWRNGFTSSSASIHSMVAAVIQVQLLLTNGLGILIDWQCLLPSCGSHRHWLPFGLNGSTSPNPSASETLVVSMGNFFVRQSPTMTWSPLSIFNLSIEQREGDTQCETTALCVPSS